MTERTSAAPVPVVQALARHAAGTPDRTCLIFGREALSYAELWRRAGVAAVWLAARGVSPGDRVALGADARDPLFAVAYFAAHRLGAAAVPLDPALPAPARAAILERVAPCFALLHAEREALAAELAGGDASRAPPFVPPAAGTVSDILFTSGTTGSPKGVVLTHGATAAAARNINAFIGNGPDDREVVTVPLSHSFGLGRLRCVVAAGGALIPTPGLAFPGLVFRALEEHRATGLSCVPAGAAILMQPDASRLAAAGRLLRYVELGSAPMPAASKRRLMAALPAARLCMHYGLTEASRSAFIEFHADRERLDTVGRASPNTQIAVRDAAGRPVPPGETGRIAVRGASVMRAYWRDPAATSRALDAEGWFDTGDFGRLDAEGWLTLMGRADDIINVGGRKVSPEAVEALAREHPGVRDAACVALGDAEGLVGEVPALFFEAIDGQAVDPAALRAHLAAGLPAWAAPRLVEQIAALPRTASGKLRRAALRGETA